LYDEIYSLRERNVLALQVKYTPFGCEMRSLEGAKFIEIG